MSPRRYFDLDEHYGLICALKSTQDVRDNRFVI